MPGWEIPLGTILSGLYSNATAKGADARQLAQQGALNRQAMGQNKEMIQYGMGMQRQMWKETGPVGSMEQLKEAGLNPGLLYGMGGAGGQSLGNPGTGGNQSGTAPSGSGREKQEFASIGLQLASQLALQDSQKKNIDADTANKQAQNPNIPLQGENIQASTANLLQGINNQKAIEELTKAQTRIANLDGTLKGQTLDDQVEIVNYEAKRACQEAQQAVNNTNVSDATIQDKIKIIKRTAIEKFLNNIQIGAQTDKTKSDIGVNETLRRKMSADIEQGWGKLTMEQMRQQLTKDLTEQGLDIQKTDQIIRGVTGVMQLGRPGATITDQSYRPSEHHTTIENY